MKTWEVKLYETVIHTAIVKARNEEEAYDVGYEQIANGPSSGYTTEAEGFTGDFRVERYEW